MTAAAVPIAVELLTIGDELLLGFTIDTNGPFLARALGEIGVRIARRTSVGDRAPEIAAAVRDALDRTGAVITTGGLGPTSDDLTKPTIAALFGREMLLDQAILEQMQERWRTRFQRPLPESNRQQAMLPAGARVLVNRHGSAPGVWLEDDRGRWVAMLPGVPGEMRGMTGDELVPLLRARGAGGGIVIRSTTVRTTGISESLLADLLAEMARGFPGLSLAYLPGYAGTDLRLTSESAAGPAADASLAAAAARLRERVGSYVYGKDDDDLAAVVLQLCRERGLRLAVAESCTGGLLGERLTSVPGSSDVFRGGVIAYHDDVKRVHLDVPEAMLRAHGAVSEPVARQMASAARTRFDATIGIAITGVAGPGGGSEEKPVGTTWIAIDLGGDNRAHRARFIGGRDEVRRRASQAALEMVRRAVSNEPQHAMP